MAILGLVFRRALDLFRRVTSPESKSSSEDNSTGNGQPRLCHFDDLPKWYQDNPYILSAYRPVSDSYHSCVYSLGYLHNESMNIYTHLTPAILLALALPTLQIQISRIYHDAPWTDRYMLTLTPMTALLTLTLSSTYHTFMNHSPYVSLNCLLFDYTGILALILSSFISGIYVGFYESPIHQRMYWAMIASLIAVSCLLVLHPRLQGPLYRPHRTTAFTLTALSGFAPVIHGCVFHGVYEAFWNRGVMWWLAEGFWYGLGVVLFAKRFPESSTWAKEKGRDGKMRGNFDVWGSSHQLFHCCVVLGAGCHCWGVWWAWRSAV